MVCFSIKVCCCRRLYIIQTQYTEVMQKKFFRMRYMRKWSITIRIAKSIGGRMRSRLMSFWSIVMCSSCILLNENFRPNLAKIPASPEPFQFPAATRSTPKRQMVFVRVLLPSAFEISTHLHEIAVGFWAGSIFLPTLLVIKQLSL
jgi:hypothetical protein